MSGLWHALRFSKATPFWGGLFLWEAIIPYSSGSYSRLYSWQTDASNGINITDTRMDAEFDGISTALSACLLKDGTQTVTANIPMANFKFTGLGSGTARTDSANAGQAQDGLLNWADGGGTADAITASYSPAITALVDGQICFVRATAANATTTPTFSPSGITARIIVKNGGAALSAGDIVGDGHQLILRYDLANTRWELLNPGASVTGPASSTNGNLAAFSVTDGKTIADSGIAPGTILRTTNNLSDLASASTARTNLGLGTAAIKDTGTSAGNVVVLDGSARLPAVDGSQLTNLNIGDTYADIGQLFLAVARLDTPTSPNVGGTQIADEFDDSTGISSLGGGAVTGGYLTNTSAGSVVSSSAASGTQSAGAVIITREFSLTNSATYSTIGVYLTSAVSITLKVVKRNSAGNYDVVYSQAVSHGGAGWQDFTLTAPYSVPGSGAYHVGVYATGSIASFSAARAVNGGANDAVGTGYTYTESTGGAPVMRATATGSTANITTVSVTYTAGSAPSTVSLVAEYQDVSTTAVTNTDIIFDVTRDGATWGAVTMADFGPSPVTGARVLKGSLSVSGQPSGTSVEWRIRTLNAKEQRVHGVWMQWR